MQPAHADTAPPFMLEHVEFETLKWGDWFNKRWSGGRLRLLVVSNFFFTPLGVAFLLVDANAWYFYVIWFFSSMGSMFQYGGN